MEEKKKRKVMESEVLEIIAFAATVALVISGLKLLLPLVFQRWMAVAAVTAPPPLLFLLLHLTVASIVLVSIHQSLIIPTNHRYICRHGRSRRSKRKKRSAEEKDKWEERADEVEGDADELNAKVEAFIKEFRQRLRIESFSSRFEASQL